MHAHFEQVEWGLVYLAAGATTVRDCGNELEFITSVRDAIASRRGLGPRILAAGIVDGSGPRTCGVQCVDDAEQARQWVDRYHELGFQQIKVYSSMKLENVAAVAREAHRLGMTVTGHVANGVTLRQAVEAGQDQVNHCGYVLHALAPDAPDDATIGQLTDLVRGIDPASPAARDLFDFLREHRVVVDPTIAYTEFGTTTREHPLESFEPGAAKLPPELAAGTRGFDVPADRAAFARLVFEKQLAIVGALHRAGIPIVAGTDQLVPGHSLHREIELYVQAGLSPLEAIQAATIVPARAMGLEGESGSIEVGKRADLILVDGNPLRDIREIRKVRSVVTDGVLYDCASLWRSVGFQP
jgi:imidazolonepropionase-like amidohydrolase